MPMEVEQRFEDSLPASWQLPRHQTYFVAHWGVGGRVSWTGRSVCPKRGTGPHPIPSFSMSYYSPVLSLFWGVRNQHFQTKSVSIHSILSSSYPPVEGNNLSPWPWSVGNGTKALFQGNLLHSISEFPPGDAPFLDNHTRNRCGPLSPWLTWDWLDLIILTGLFQTVVRFWVKQSDPALAPLQWNSACQPRPLQAPDVVLNALKRVRLPVPCRDTSEALSSECHVKIRNIFVASCHLSPYRLPLSDKPWLWNASNALRCCGFSHAMVSECSADII